MELYYTKETEKPFDEVVEKAQEIAKQKGFGVMAVHDFKAAFAKKNLEFTPYKIVEICKPEFAHKALQEDTNLGLIMPCKINVYQKGDKVIVTGLLTDILKSFSSVELGELPDTVSKLVKEIVDETVKA
ncbi:hypothetical protein IPdc08_01747 [archaeon]|nr:hypothetical protein IPdc08_01747 [archaeon]